MTSLSDALMYAIEGNKPFDGEHSPIKDNGEDDDEMVDIENSCFEVGILNNGLLYNLGSVDQLKGMTKSRMLALVQYKRMMKFGASFKDAEARALGEYYAVLEEIKGNHMNEVNKNG